MTIAFCHYYIVFPFWCFDGHVFKNASVFWTCKLLLPKKNNLSYHFTSTQDIGG